MTQTLALKKPVEHDDDDSVTFQALEDVVIRFDDGAPDRDLDRGHTVTLPRIREAKAIADMDASPAMVRLV